MPLKITLFSKFESPDLFVLEEAQKKWAQYILTVIHICTQAPTNKDRDPGPRLVSYCVQKFTSDAQNLWKSSKH